MDASIFHHAETIGFGFINRNEKGEIGSRVYHRACGLKDHLVAEALGCREALSWPKNTGVQRVVVETDNLLLVQVVNKQGDYLLMLV